MSTASDGRSTILARLRAARRTARLPAVTASGVPVRDTPATQVSLDRFQSELDLLGVECFIERSSAEVLHRVAALISQQRVLSWNRDMLPYGIGAWLRDPILASDAIDRQVKAEIGLTGCDAAIAETGTLAMLSERGKSRTVSLLPPVHLAVVRLPDLCFSMADFFRLHARSLAAAASCTFITGPSRTADIELTLTLGVHGPGKVIVVVGP